MKVRICFVDGSNIEMSDISIDSIVDAFYGGANNLNGIVTITDKAGSIFKILNVNNVTFVHEVEGE